MSRYELASSGGYGGMQIVIEKVRNGFILTTSRSSEKMVCASQEDVLWFVASLINLKKKVVIDPAELERNFSQIGSEDSPKKK